MEKKIESLRNSIKSNPNLSEEFKCNLGTLTDTMVTVFPEYDYSNYEAVLSSLIVKDDTVTSKRHKTVLCLSELLWGIVIVTRKCKMSIETHCIIFCGSIDYLGNSRAKSLHLK